MATPTASARPSPERIFNVLTAYQQSAALKTGIDLDVFTAIGAGANTAPSLAEKIGASQRGVRILCDCLTIHGFLTKQGGCYALTPESAIFLNRHSPACLASMSDFLTNPRNKKAFEALPEAVRKGGTPSATGDNTKPNDELWIQFARAMAPLTVPAAAGLAAAITYKERFRGSRVATPLLWRSAYLLAVEFASGCRRRMRPGLIVRIITCRKERPHE